MRLAKDNMPVNVDPLLPDAPITIACPAGCRCCLVAPIDPNKGRKTCSCVFCGAKEVLFSNLGYVKLNPS